MFTVHGDVIGAHRYFIGVHRDIKGVHRDVTGVLWDGIGVIWDVNGVHDVTMQTDVVGVHCDVRRGHGEMCGLSVSLHCGHVLTFL